MTELAEGEIEGKVIIPEFVVDEIENQANKRPGNWLRRYRRNQKLRELRRTKGFEVSKVESLQKKRSDW